MRRSESRFPRIIHFGWSDREHGRNIDQVIADARMLVLRGLKPPLPANTPDNHTTLVALRDPPLKERIRLKTKELLIEEELRRRR